MSRTNFISSPPNHWPGGLIDNPRVGKKISNIRREVNHARVGDHGGALRYQQIRQPFARDVQGGRYSLIRTLAFMAQSSTRRSADKILLGLKLTVGLPDGCDTESYRMFLDVRTNFAFSDWYISIDQSDVIIHSSLQPCRCSNLWHHLPVYDPTVFSDSWIHSLSPDRTQDVQSSIMAPHRGLHEPGVFCMSHDGRKQ